MNCVIKFFKRMGEVLKVIKNSISFDGDFMDDYPTSYERRDDYDEEG